MQLRQRVHRALVKSGVYDLSIRSVTFGFDIIPRSIGASRTRCGHESANPLRATPACGSNDNFNSGVFQVIPGGITGEDF